MVIGLSRALYLTKEGYEVLVIDRGEIIEGISFGNAGYVSPSHFIPLASPAIVYKAMKWMLNSTRSVRFITVHQIVSEADVKRQIID